MENNQDQLKNCSVKIIKIIIMIRLISLTFVSHFLRKNKQNKFQSNTRAKNNFNMMKNNNGMKKQKKRNNQWLLNKDLSEYYNPRLVHLSKIAERKQDNKINFLKKIERNKLPKLRKTEIRQPGMLHLVRKMFGSKT